MTAAGRTSGLSAQRAFTVRTNWPEYGFNASGDSSNPYENTLAVGSVPNLQESFTFAAGSQVTGVSVANGLAYVATSGGTVYAVNAATGVQKWSFATGAEVAVTPAVSGNTVFFGTYGGPGKVYALNASTGATIWTDDLSTQESNGFTGSPIVARGLVYIGGESGNEYALNAANVTRYAGGGRWGAVRRLPGIRDSGQIYSLRFTPASRPSPTGSSSGTRLSSVRSCSPTSLIAVVSSSW